MNEFYPIVLIRGFDLPGESNADPFTGFNDGTVYLDGVSGGRVFEGFMIGFLKDRIHRYRDTSNLIRFHEPVQRLKPQPAAGLYPDSCFTPADDDLQQLLGWHDAQPSQDGSDPLDWHRRTIWVFRYYDAIPGAINQRLGFDVLPYFARELQRYIATVKWMTGSPLVNIICHSMGGLIVRHLLHRRYRNQAQAEQQIHRIVSLGTPHGGITYADGNSWLTELLGAQETVAMDPQEIAKPSQDDTFNQQANVRQPDYLAQSGFGFVERARRVLERLVSGGGVSPYGLDGQSLAGWWNARRWLCVVGTRYHDYKWKVGTLGLGKRSDGLVTQSSAVLNAAPRAYLHKTHGGRDSLMTSRESFEVATRFLFGTHWVRLFLRRGAKLKGFDPRREYYLGCSVKPRGVDFFLTQVDAVSENTIILYRRDQATGDQLLTKDGELRKNLCVYAGAIDAARSVVSMAAGNPGQAGPMVFRLDFVVFAEDKPLADGGKRPLHFTALGMSDLRPVSEQILIEATVDRPYPIRWRTSADAPPATDKVDKQILPDNAGALQPGANLVYTSGLNLKAPQFEGTFALHVQEFAKYSSSSSQDDAKLFAAFDKPDEKLPG